MDQILIKLMQHLSSILILKISKQLESIIDEESDGVYQEPVLSALTRFIKS